MYANVATVLSCMRLEHTEMDSVFIFYCILVQAQRAKLWPHLIRTMVVLSADWNAPQKSLQSAAFQTFYISNALCLSVKGQSANTNLCCFHLLQSPPLPHLPRRPYLLRPCRVVVCCSGRGREEKRGRKFSQNSQIVGKDPDNPSPAHTRTRLFE